MSNVWERFNNIANADEVKSATENAKEKRASFTPLEEGEYNVTMEWVKATTTPNQGIPAMNVKLRTVESNRVIFTSWLLQNIYYPERNAETIGDAIAFVNDATHQNHQFTTLGDFASFLDNMAVYDDKGEVNGLKDGLSRTFKVRLWYSKKDKETKKYPNVTFVGDIETEQNSDFVSIPDGIDDEVPFL